MSCSVLGPMTTCGQTTILENFDGVAVANQDYLDPTTVVGSGWTRKGVGAADWDVHCCSRTLADPSREDNTFDDSDKFLVL